MLRTMDLDKSFVPRTICKSFGMGALSLQVLDINHIFKERFHLGTHYNAILFISQIVFIDNIISLRGGVK